jgi:hypothetical protein
MNITKEQMLLNMERVRRHVPYDVWFAIVCLIESSGEKGDEPLLPENVWKTTLRELRELREVTVNPVDLATIHRACLVLDELLFIRRQPAPSPGPSSSIEGYPASVKQALTVPAPLLAAKLSSYLEKKHE